MHKVKSISFRYFNAAGADKSGKLGEDHDPETHLIPSILKLGLLKENSPALIKYRLRVIPKPTIM